MRLPAIRFYIWSQPVATGPLFRLSQNFVLLLWRRIGRRLSHQLLGIFPSIKGIWLQNMDRVVFFFVRRPNRLWTSKTQYVFTGPKSDHCLPLSQTHELTHYCFGDLTDMQICKKKFQIEKRDVIMNRTELSTTLACRCDSVQWHTVTLLIFSLQPRTLPSTFFCETQESKSEALPTQRQIY